MHSVGGVWNPPVVADEELGALWPCDEHADEIRYTLRDDGERVLVHTEIDQATRARD